MSRWLVSVWVVLSTGFTLSATELDPIPPGPHPVAMTNLEVRPQSDAKAMFGFLNGKTSAEGTRYLTDILVHPDAVPTRS